MFFTKSKPLGGVAKQRYSDFVVEEVTESGEECKVEFFNNRKDGERAPLVIPESEGKEQLHLELEKLNTSTSQAVSNIARNLRLSRKRIGYAGLKDKRAITSQKISLWKPEKERLDSFYHPMIYLKNAEWNEKKLDLGNLKGNIFHITIRNLDKTEEEIKTIFEEFKTQTEKGIPNYFGPQRFGGKRKVTHEVGKLLLEEKFEEAVMLYLTKTFDTEHEDMKLARTNLAKTRNYAKAVKEFPVSARTERTMIHHLCSYENDFLGAFGKLPKKIRYLFTHALQSHLFNKMIEKRIELFGEKALEPIDGDEFINGVPAVLLPGFESTFAEGKAGEIEKLVMEEEGLKLEDFKVRGMSDLSSKGMRKQLLLKPEKIKFEGIEEDDFNEGKKMMHVSFFLSKGNYATTVLRELLKEDVF